MRQSINGFLSGDAKSEIKAAIPGRFSVRRFEAPPSPAQLAALAYLSGRLCLSGVRIRIGSCDALSFSPRLLPSMTITGAERYALITYNESENPLALFAAGFSGQAFVLRAWAQGVKSCWTDGSFKREKINLPIGSGERIASVIALGVAETPKRPLCKRKTAAQITEGDYSKYPLWAQSALEGVRLSPSSLNRQPWTVGFSSGRLRISVKQDAMLELGIAVLQAEAMLKQNGKWEIDMNAREASVAVDE